MNYGDFKWIKQTNLCKNIWHYLQVPDHIPGSTRYRWPHYNQWEEGVESYVTTFQASKLWLFILFAKAVRLIFSHESLYVKWRKVVLSGPALELINRSRFLCIFHSAAIGSLQALKGLSDKVWNMHPHLTVGVLIPTLSSTAFEGNLELFPDTVWLIYK